MTKLTLINPPGTEATYEKFKFSQAVVAGGRVEVAGTVGIREDYSIAEDVGEQARQAFVNLKRTLEAAGSNLEHVLHLTQYVTNIRDLKTIDAVFGEFFPANYPARTVVQVAALIRPEFKLEIQASAATLD